MRLMQGTQDLWTFYADSAVAFEKKMSILRGIYIDNSQMDHDGKFTPAKVYHGLDAYVCLSGSHAALMLSSCCEPSSVKGPTKHEVWYNTVEQYNSTNPTCSCDVSSSPFCSTFLGSAMFRNALVCNEVLGNLQGRLPGARAVAWSWYSPGTLGGMLG